MTEHKQGYRFHYPEKVDGSVTPTCSCGWEGNSVGNWNDYQHTMLNEQFERHLKEVSTKTMHIFWSFNEYSGDGVTYCMVDHETPSEGYTYVMAVEVPVIDKDVITELAVKDIDNKIIDAKLDIKKLEDKKAQLLCLENK
jgi:hypothetical protein